ncbi:hypothetical protein Moror_4918 [Moniliophthora roreri MCA 2997]|uniref:Uncharacterized protein n=1 Tax=Moniliophthora roreri (strain MCA 2997) TaxID=1381753 RepID=V2X1V5_MONRO|nr:hypothetical protein Moror_4918 [Moniliophthora roreri MCA 2997]KAI3603272.1 hypothetical protein WG66_002293 [Moniliophthora roreri]
MVRKEAAWGNVLHTTNSGEPRLRLKVRTNSTVDAFVSLSTTWRSRARPRADGGQLLRYITSSIHLQPKISLKAQRAAQAR